MKVAIIGGGPAGLYSAILLKKQRPEADDHGLRAQPRRRYLRLRRGVFGCDARQFREIRSAELSPDHAGIRLLGRYRRALPRHGASRRRQRLLRLLAPPAAPDLAGARARTRRQADLRDRDRRRVALCRRRSRGARRRHQQPLPREIRRRISSPKSTCAPTCSPGWVRPGRSMPSPSSSRRRSGDRSSRMPINMKSGDRPGFSRPIPRPSSAPA